MEWTDRAIVLSTRPHGESSAVAVLLTREHGRHAGLVKGGRGKAARAALQPGNLVAVRWRARLAEQLGSFTWELVAAPGTAWRDDPARLAGLRAACAMAEVTLAERESQTSMFEGLVAFLASLPQPDWPARYVRWEVDLLAALGFGLDLSRCAVTGARRGLAFVSPRTGRAVGAEAGEDYRDRLLVLPGFLTDAEATATATDVAAGLALTGYFFERHVGGPGGNGLPAARGRLVERLRGLASAAQGTG